MTELTGPAGTETKFEYLSLRPERLAALAETCLAVAGVGGAFWAPRHRPEGWVWEPQNPAEIDCSTWSAFVNTLLSPKAILLPQTEELFGWESRQNDLRITPSRRADGSLMSAVLFGVRPCDAAALQILDQALLEGPWPDDSYGAARERTLTVTWACGATTPECFCDACGLNPAAEGGDLMVLPAPGESSGESTLLLRGLTERGREVLARLAEGDSPAGPETAAEYRSRHAALAGRRTAIGQRIDLRAVRGATEEESLVLFNSPAWPTIAQRCISCGACAYVCPTCHCFAVSDEAGFQGGRRVRTWDSCQFKEYMVAAGGHNPRPTKTERVRQRFMHKLSYHRVRHGRLMCVGCGRCAQACPVGLHVAEAAAVLLEGEATRL